MARAKAVLDALFNSPYLDKADVVLALSAAVILFKLPLSAEQQAAAVVLLGIAYVVAHKIENALTAK